MLPGLKKCSESYIVDEGITCAELIEQLLSLT